MTLHLGDCLEILPSIPANSIDSIVTDCPYGLRFMGNKWDYDVPSIDIWRECLRVLKPGGHLLTFGGTRTVHRITIGIEDAGFEIRDMIAWAYGSGMPKIHDVGKQLAKIGNTKFDGFMNCLKPAIEPVVMARKPIERGLTIAENVATWGTGALNVGACRVGKEAITYKPRLTVNSNLNDDNWSKIGTKVQVKPATGRYPANLILSAEEEVFYHFPHTKTGKCPADAAGIYGTALERRSTKLAANGGDEGSAARYFKQVGPDDETASRLLYIAKPSRAERELGLQGVPLQPMPGSNGIHHDNSKEFDHMGMRKSTRANNHSTVKPIALMRYLCRLVTQPGGVVLDPFMGSGTTGIAALREGFSFIGVERDEGFLAIAEKRIAAA